MQIYFLPDASLEAVPFGAFKFGDQFLIEKVPVGQASSLRTLGHARLRWEDICTAEEPPRPEVEQCLSGRQALVISHGSPAQKTLMDKETTKLREMLNADVLSGERASKEAVIDKLGRPASLILFLVHGVLMGKTNRQRY